MSEADEPEPSLAAEAPNFARRGWPFAATMVAVTLCPVAVTAAPLALVMWAGPGHVAWQAAAIAAAAFAIVFVRAANAAARWICIGPGNVFHRLLRRSFHSDPSVRGVRVP